MAYRTLTLDTKGHLALITLARPERGNAVDGALIRELDEACGAVNDDPDVRVAILTGAGDVFCSGWEPSIPAEERHATFSCLESMGQPVICALNGDAGSAGLELALACDVRIAAEGARFALPETAHGEIPGAGGTQRLARLAGRAEALRLVLLGEEIDGEEAHRIGLVSAVVPRGRLQAEAEALAGRMASRGPIALRFAKEAVRRGLELPLDQALRYETDLTMILQTTEDRAEGVRAFMEKRKPEFNDR